MPADCSDIRIDSHHRPGRTQLGTRLSYRGWLVDVDPSRGTVSLPNQPVPPASSVDDLAVCIDAAQTLTRRRARPVPAATPTPPPPAQALATVLQSAKHIAREQWHPTRFDIYQCTSQAWTDADMPVPHTALIRVLRRALPPNVLLIDFNDNSTRAQICDLYDNAIALLLTRSANRSAQGAA